MKKFALVLLTLTLILTTASVPIYATNASNTTDTVIGYSSERADLIETAHIVNIVNYNQKPSETIYKITNVQGFQTLHALVSNGRTLQGVTLYLANDVNFEGVSNFKPIGFNASIGPNSPANGFRGTFDGLGNMVTNLRINVTTTNANANAMGGAALFYCLNGATIKNLIVGQGCTFSYDTANDADHGCVAGIAVMAQNVTIENCMNLATLSNASRFTGGMVARLFGTSTIKNCTNAGALTGCQNVGGMVAYWDGTSLNVQNCRNTGTVLCKRSRDTSNRLVGMEHSAAGIVAWSRKAVTINGCINNASVTSIDNAGGIAGQLGNDPYTDCRISNFSAVLTNNINYGAVALNDAKTHYSNGNVCAPTAAPEGSVYAECNTETGVSLTDSNNLDLRGTTDSTNVTEILTPDYTERTHVMGEAQIIQNATHTATGSVSYSCTECTYSMIEILPKLSGHTYGGWIYADTARHKATCTCNNITYEAHSWGEGIITQAPTHTVKGVKSYTCSGCNATKIEEIACTTEHTHVAQKGDKINHKKVCACGDTVYEAHKWDAGTIVTPATETAEGKVTYTCTDCSETMDAVLPKYPTTTAPETTTTPETTTASETTTAPDATTASEATMDRDGVTALPNGASTDVSTDQNDHVNITVGCDASVVGGFALIAMVSGAAIVLLKKKEN